VAGTGALTTLDLNQFESSCGCGTFSNCREVTVNFFDNNDPGVNYGCDFLVIRASNGMLSEDYFDVFDPDNCTQYPEQNSFYQIFTNDSQFSKTYLICQGNNPTWTELTFDSESASCEPQEDCDSDSTPPNCIISDITINGNDPTGSVTVDFNEYFVDDCDTDLEISGWNNLTQMVIGEFGEVPCGETVKFDMTANDDEQNTVDCSFIVTVEYGNDGSCAFDVALDFYQLVGNDERNIFIKAETVNSDLFVLSLDGESNSESPRLAKYNSSGNLVWESIWEDSLYFNNFLIDGDRVFLAGFTRPFENGNLSVLAELKDLGNSYSIVSSKKFDLNSQREAARGLIKLNNTTTPYAMLLHKGWISNDDTQIALLDNGGNIVEIRNYSFSDDQVWNGPVNDLDNTITIFGEEANDVNEGFLINAKHTLVDYEAFSFFGIGYIRDVGVDHTRRQRLIASNKSLTLADQNYNILESIGTSNVLLNRQIEGPFIEAGNTIYFLLSIAEYLGSDRAVVTKIEINQNNQMNILWSKAVDIEGAVVGANFSVSMESGSFQFILGQSIENPVNGFGNLDIALSNFGEESCKLLDFDLETQAKNINLVNQEMTVTNQSIPSSLELNQDSGNPYLCSEIDNCDDIPTECSEECQADNIDLSTGIDFIDGSLLSLGQYDGGWVMIAGPDMDLNYPQPGFVLTPDGAWSGQLDAQYISPFANTSNNMSFPIPYTFERQFCICEPTEVSLDIAALFDNFIDIGLYDDSGSLIEQLLNIQTNSQDNFQIPSPSTTTHQLSPGIYSLRAGLRNDASVSMGFAIEATLSGAGLIESGCCSPYQYITGTVFEDTSCDSVYNLNIDEVTPSINIILCNSDGQVVDESITDSFGFFVFEDVEPGIYFVKHSDDDNLNLTLGEGGYQITVEENSVNSNIDFGNCSNPCVNDTTPPTCITQDINVVLDDQGLANITSEMIDNGSFDDCGNVTFNLSQEEFDCDDIGQNTIILTVTDEAGIISTCPAMVIIEDKTAPIIACSVAATLELNANGMLSLSLNNLGISIEEACKITVEFSQQTFNCNDLGEHVITTTITDDGDNVVTCQTLLTVVDPGMHCVDCEEDNNPPIISCNSQVVTYVLNSSGVAEIDLDLHQVSATDDCGLESVIASILELTCDDVSTVPYYIKVFATDLAGNISECQIGYIVLDPEEYCIPEGCDSICYSGTIDLSTGIDNDGTVLPIGQYVGNWLLIDGPDLDVTYPRPGYVLNPNTVWDQLPGSQYISPFPNATNNGSFSVPYLFERCFCVCEETADVELNISAHVDNFIDIGLYDENGVLIQDLISYNGPPHTSTFLDPAFHSNTTHTLTAGRYCLRAGLRNDGSVTMGMQINAAVSNAGFISSKCCTPYAFILGTVFQDLACDTLNNLNQDIGLFGIEVSLIQNGVVIESTLTDQFGYYVFSDVPTGNYDVVTQGLTYYTPSLGGSGYSIEMTTDTVIGDIDFGLCEQIDSCCASPEVLTEMVHSQLNSEAILCDVNSATVEIVKPDLLECQYISTIYWGDGEFIMLDSNDEIPSHTYNGDGVYLLSIEVTAVTEIGDVCQIDVVDQVLIIKDCIVSTDFPNQDRSTIKIYPIPFKDIVNIDFSKNTGGFSLEIFSVMGQLIDEVNIPSNQTKYIYTNQNMVSGTYLFTLKSLDGDITLQSKVIRI